MARSTESFIGLLRGINVGGHNKIPMAELRALCGEIGWSDTRSYIQSGNLVFSATGKPAALETALEHAITERFGLTIPALVRRSKEWGSLVDSNPFAAESKKQPKFVTLLLSKKRPNSKAAEELQPYAAANERVVATKNALWVYFGGGTARSRLSPAVLDRVVGSTVTARNWRTVLKIAEMLGE